VVYILKPNQSVQVKLKRDGSTVLLAVSDKTARLSGEIAKKFGALLIQAGLKAEEEAKAQSIALDHAILPRAGVRVGLSDRRDIQDEAGKLAAWDGDLRRYMPNSIRSEASLGTPTITNHSKRRSNDA